MRTGAYPLCVLELFETDSAAHAKDDVSMDHDGDYPLALRFFFQRDEESPNSGDARFASRRTERAAEAVRSAVTDAARRDAEWRDGEPVGGAGDNGIVELAVQGVSLVAGLVAIAKNGPEVWNRVREFLAVANSDDGEHWNASSEVAILRCLEEVRSQNPDFRVDPDTVRIVEDGTEAGAFEDMPEGLHVIVIPDLSAGHTHLFVIDEALHIHHHAVLPRLTSDAASRA